MAGEGDCHRLTLSHCALSHGPGSHGVRAQATITMDRKGLAALLVAGQTFTQALEHGLMTVTGDQGAVASLFATLDSFVPMFNILEP